MYLFSAPFEFLEPEFRAELTRDNPLEFRLINEEDELGFDERVTCWIPNPGQRFTARASVLRAFPNLKLISTPSTGSNHIDRDFFAEKGVAVRSLLDNRPRLASIRASSEFTLLLVLSSLRKIRTAFLELDEKRWRHREEVMRGSEVIGQKVGIVGMGRNGSNVARWLTAMEADVRYFDPYKKEPPGKIDSIKQLFEESQIVILTVVLTNETEGMVGRDLLERLPLGAHLINTSRGEIINENELAVFLDEREDVSYAADVVTGEVDGRPFESPLYELYLRNRVTLTPHIAGVSFGSQTKAALGALENVRDFLKEV
ncbi:MAG: NAD(P)-dependent oxidoreductase [Verrucomicrobiota bacterium]